MNKKHCLECGKELFRKVWYGKKRKMVETNKRWNERKFCGSECRAKNLSKTSAGENNYFYGKRLTPWNKGNKQERIVVNPRKSYTRIMYLQSNGKYRFVLEHREIYENKTGKQLGEELVVHHKDGNIKNNDFSNLIALTRAEHQKVHAECRKKNLNITELKI